MENEKRKVGDYTVLCAVNIGSREIILAENEQSANGERFLCCYGERNDIFEKFSECAVGDDYIDAALFFAERIKKDAEQFRAEVEKLDIPVTVITQVDCIPDHYKNDINGKIIAINPAVLKPEYQRADRQLYYVTGGFGASANARGSAVFCKNLAVLGAAAAAAIAVNCLFEAQKVWKLGFDAEMKAHERIVARLERFPGFDARRKYRLLQIGSFSLRRNYYRRTAGEEISLDLLETSFTPEFMSRIVYNFYYPEDVFYDNAVPGELSKAGQDFVRNRAKPWPSADAVYIDGDIVVIVLTEEGLEKARSLLYF